MLRLQIYGTESLGVRGLACVVETRERRIFFDPGMGLGWSRKGLLPHPFQIAIGARIRDEIIEAAGSVDTVVFSHFDGDHCPLARPNPYQLGLASIKEALASCRIWAKGPEGATAKQEARRQALAQAVGKELPIADGQDDGPLHFSAPFPHGQDGEGGYALTMTRVEEDGACFVHASDIQLLDDGAVDQILDWKPDTVLCAGPPLYRVQGGGQALRERAWNNAERLSRELDTLIVDHHLLRSEEGLDWLEALQRKSGRRVVSAAGFAGRQPLLLEAWRSWLYQVLPVPEDWHAAYAHGRVDAQAYRLAGWDRLCEAGKIHPCKWYESCPMRRFTEQGRLPRGWIENYCLVANESCVRFQMEERGEPHADTMLPDGSFMEA